MGSVCFDSVQYVVCVLSVRCGLCTQYVRYKHCMGVCVLCV